MRKCNWILILLLALPLCAEEIITLSSAPGAEGTVGGADNLTTANAMVYVKSAGVLDEDTEIVRAANLLTVSKATLTQNASDTTTAYQWLDADGGIPILNIDATNERVCIGCADPAERFHVWGGNLEVTDPTDLGSESLDDYNDLTDDADWDYTGEAAAVGTDAVYTFAASGNGTITQTNGEMAVVGVGYRRYKAVYVISSSTVANATVTITNAFASAAVELDTSDGTNTTYFTAASGAASANFVIDITGATAGAFTLESISIKEVQGGDVIASGLYTGGGPTGIKVLADGKAGFGTTPSQLIHALATQNAETHVLVENLSGAAGALASVSAGNVAEAASRVRMLVLGTGYTTTGGFVQDGGLLVTETNLSGGLSVMTRANAPIRFYTGGHTNFRGTILGTGEWGIGPANIAPTGTADFLDRTATTGATLVQIGTDGTNTSATSTQLHLRVGATQAVNISEISTVSGVVRYALNPSISNHQYTVGANLQWSASNSAVAGKDLGISRNTAGTLEINSGLSTGIAHFRDAILRDIELVDISDLAAESLADPGFPNGTNWAEVGDFATPAGTAVYTHSGGTGTLTQTSVQMDIAGVPNRHYKLTYTISSQSGDPACTITTAFAAVAETLTIADGAQTNYFKSAAAPANYIISCTSSSGGFTMDDMSLKEVIGGDITVNGDAHIKSLATYNGQVTAGVGQPAILGHVAVTGASSAVGATNIVASAAAGLYRVSGYMQTTTLADAACTSDVTLGWTYNSEAKALEVVSNHDQRTDETYSQIPPTVIRSGGSANITYIISLDAGGDCTNAVFDYYLTAERIQ